MRPASDLIPATPALAPATAFVMAAGGAQAGARSFATFAACRTIAAGAPVSPSPSLAGLFGKPTGTVDPRFAYSPAMKAATTAWYVTTLDVFLARPRTLVPNNRMPSLGVRDATVRADSVAFLESRLGGAPIPSR